MCHECPFSLHSNSPQTQPAPRGTILYAALRSSLVPLILPRRLPLTVALPSFPLNALCRSCSEHSQSVAGHSVSDLSTCSSPQSMFLYRLGDEGSK